MISSLTGRSTFYKIHSHTLFHLILKSAQRSGQSRYNCVHVIDHSFQTVSMHTKPITLFKLTQLLLYYFIFLTSK